MVFYVCVLVSLPLFLLFVCLSLVNDSENYLCAVGFDVCVLLCVCSKEMTLPRGGESQEGNNVRQWHQCDRNSYSRYSNTDTCGNTFRSNEETINYHN